MADIETGTTRTVILTRSSRDAKEHVTSAIKIAADVKTLTFGIEADAADWSSGDVYVTLSTELSRDGVKWRQWHGIGVDTRKGIPAGRPELIFDLGDLAGQWIRAKLTINKGMNVGVALETT